MSPDFAPPFSVLAQCAPGLEHLLEGELDALGIEGRRIRGGVEWHGGWRQLLLAQLHSRTASRVLVEVTRFRARALGELERKAREVPWDRVLAPGALRIRVSCRRSRLNHRRAVEEWIRRAASRPEGAAASGPDDSPLVLVRIHRDEVTIRLDASGEHLHRRGYRTRVGEAPLRETLGAAVVLQIRWHGEVPLFDPFCGSGTIPIEAALRALRVPPALARADRTPRDIAVLRWPDAPVALWHELADEAREAIRPGVGVAIGGSDHDPRIVEAARANARDAGVEHAVEFTHASASQAPLPPRPGWIATNPPHGGRLGSRRELRRLYTALGRTASGSWQAWGIAILASDPVLVGHLNLPLDEAFRTSSGGMPLRLLVRPWADTLSGA